MLTTRLWIQYLSNVLRDDSLPVEAARTWASRGTSLSQGISGLTLALAEACDPPLCSLVASTTVGSIFASTLTSHSDQARLEILDMPGAESELALGDVFAGYCSLVWTDLVLARPIRRLDYQPGVGTVERPGVGHGDLIRDLVQWLLASEDARGEFSSDDDVYDSGGWCYGQAGLAAVLAIAKLNAGLSKGDESRLREMPAKLIEAAYCERADSEVGLCHGVAGMLVAAIGVARLYDDQVEIAAVQQAFDQIVDDQSMIKINESLDVDCSWLTGLAGVVWAQQVMLRPPLINPIFPLDATFRASS